MAAGGGGSSGAGKEAAGATTLSDLNNFQFQEGKRELEKYRRCALAEAREEAPKGSRVCGGASLGAAKKAGEREPGSWGGTACVAGPSEGRLSRGEVDARPGSVEAEGPEAERPPRPAPESRRPPRPRLGAPSSRGPGRALCSGARTPSAARRDRALGSSPLDRLALCWRVSGCGQLPSFFVCLFFCCLSCF